MTAAPAPKPPKPLNPLLRQAADAGRKWLEKTGLKAKIDPELAKFNAMEAEKKNQVLTGLVFAVIAANLLLVMAPLITAFFDMSQKIQKISAEVALARKDIAARDQMKATFKSSSDLVSETERLTFKSDQVHQFLDVLSDLAKESRVKIESLAPVPVKGGGDLPRPLPKQYTLAGFELSGQAGYHELGNLIARLESGEPFAKVESVEVYHELSESRRSHQIKLRLLVIRRN